METNHLGSKRVLIVDDDSEARNLFSRALAREGYIVESCSSAHEALEELLRSHYDLALMDILMPEVGGLELLRQVRGDEKTSNLPVILVSALDDVEAVVAGLKEGANDYITKPINAQILLARVQTHITVGSLIQELEEQKELQARLATYDYLTQIPNRRAFCASFEAEIDRSRRRGHELALLMMDIDHFKKVNDVYGHLAGDAVLVEFAKRISAKIRSSDVLGRYGGEEFCVLLPETSSSGAALLAERCRVAVEKDPFKTEYGEFTVTVSVGFVSTVPAGQTDSAKMLETADKALYQAKADGRNQVRQMDMV